MKNTLLNGMIAELKQAMIDEAAGELVNQFEFTNHGDRFKVIAQVGAWSVIYDCSRDRLIVAWALKPFNDGTGAWGNGFYFDNEGGNDLIERYKIDDVASFFIDKVFPDVE